MASHRVPSIPHWFGNIYIYVYIHIHDTEPTFLARWWSNDNPEGPIVGRDTKSTASEREINPFVDRTRTIRHWLRATIRRLTKCPPCYSSRHNGASSSSSRIISLECVRAANNSLLFPLSGRWHTVNDRSKRLQLLPAVRVSAASAGCRCILRVATSIGFELGNLDRGSSTELIVAVLTTRGARGASVAIGKLVISSQLGFRPICCY